MNVFVVVLFVGFVFSVFGQNASDFNFSVNDKKITITGYNREATKNVTIPANITGGLLLLLEKRHLQFHYGGKLSRERHNQYNYS